MKKRKALLIGVGGWGRIHLDAFASSSRWKISALADKDVSLLAKTGRELDLPTRSLFHDPLKAIERADYDAIAVVVRNPARMSILLEALRRGVPVLVEKPLVHTLADLRKVFRVVRNSKAPLMVSQNYRFEPQTRRLVQFIQDRKTWGALRNINIRFVRSIRELGDHYVRHLPEGLGLGAEMGVHHYDLMRFLTGQNPVRIRAIAHHTPTGAMEGWGGLDAWLEFPESTFISYHADYEVPVSRTPWGGDWDLDFEKGSLRWYPYASDKDPLELHSPLKGRWKLKMRQNASSDLFAYHLVDRVHQAFAIGLDDDQRFECGPSR